MKNKKFRLAAIAGVLSLAAFFPQEALAYKYYIHYPDGSRYMFHADNRETALAMFRFACGSGSFNGLHVRLSTRPNGGFLEECGAVY